MGIQTGAGRDVAAAASSEIGARGDGLMTDVSTPAVGAPPAHGAGLRRLAAIATLLLLVLAAVAALFIVRTVDNQLEDIGNTYEIRRGARELALSVVDAETGQRGYLLTQDPAYLEPYNGAVGTLDETYARLLALVGGNEAKRLRIEALMPDLTAKRTEMARTIELASTGRVAEALELLRSDTGFEIMARLRTAIRAFIAEEDASLIERNALMETYRTWLVAAIIAALAATAVLAYLLFSRSQREVASLSQRQSVLVSQNEELEARVSERTAEAEEARERAERERQRLETLLQDTNHRIGNSLATVSSLLGLQVARSKSDEVRSALEAAQGRVQAIASGHRRLRLGADLETTDAAEFLGSVVDDLAASVPAGNQVKVETDFDPLIIPARDATTIGIVVSELVTNAVKHAFPDRPGTIWVRFRVSPGGGAALTVDDDGCGLPNDEPVGGGLGALIIRQLARQFGGGEPDYRPRLGGGTSITVLLPELKVTSR